MSIALQPVVSIEFKLTDLWTLGMAENTRKRKAASQSEDTTKRLRIDNTILFEGTSKFVEAFRWALLNCI